MYSLYFSLMAIFCSNWQYANSIWSRAGIEVHQLKDLVEAIMAPNDKGKVLLATCAG